MAPILTFPQIVSLVPRAGTSGGGGRGGVGGGRATPGASGGGGTTNLSGGVIAGIAVGVVFGALLLAGLWYGIRNFRRKGEQKNDPRQYI
jgi:hypothetical protein